MQHLYILVRSLKSRIYVRCAGSRASRNSGHVVDLLLKVINLLQFDIDNIIMCNNVSGLK